MLWPWLPLPQTAAGRRVPDRLMPGPRRLPAVMPRYFEAHGFRAFAFAGNWSDIERHVQLGRPLIVALQPDSGPSFHYVVIAGFDELRQPDSAVELAAIPCSSFFDRKMLDTQKPMNR